MKKSNQLLVLTFLFLMSSNLVLAQTVDKKLEAKEQYNIAKQKLALTPNQEPVFKEITKKYATKMRDLRPSQQERAEKLNKLKELQSQKDVEVKAILTDEQYKTYLQLRDERKTMRKNRKKD